MIRRYLPITVAAAVAAGIGASAMVGSVGADATPDQQAVDGVSTEAERRAALASRAAEWVPTELLATTKSADLWLANGRGSLAGMSCFVVVDLDMSRPDSGAAASCGKADRRDLDGATVWRVNSDGSKTAWGFAPKGFDASVESDVTDARLLSSRGFEVTLPPRATRLVLRGQAGATTELMAPRVPVVR